MLMNRASLIKRFMQILGYHGWNAVRYDWTGDDTIPQHNADVAASIRGPGKVAHRDVHHRGVTFPQV